jgi:alpha-1,3-rhamnosyl/mannosyltransferase
VRAISQARIRRLNEPEAEVSGSIHVGVDATSWPNERGFGRFTRSIIRALASRDTGFRYTLLFDRPPSDGVPAGAAMLCADTGKTLVESAVGRSSRSPSYFWRMGQLTRRERFDVFFYPALYSYFPLFARVPSVVCFHDATAERFPELLFPTRFNRALWRAKTALAKLQATRAMTISRASAADLQSILGLPASRIDVVTEAAGPAFRTIDDRTRIEAARVRHGIPADGPLLVHVGGLNRHKNVLGLLQAMTTVVAQHPGVRLAIVGDTSGKGFWDNVDELKGFVARHPPLDEHVYFTGYVDDAALAELLNGAYALAFPSLWEGFGLPAVEAMACGVPVLASQRGSLPEVVGEAGVYFDPENPAAIAASVLTLLRDPERRDRLAAHARLRAREFTWDRAAELAEASFRRSIDEATRG